mgnify:CR=1 FL=1
MGEPPWRTVVGPDLMTIAGSGVIGIVVADTLFHASLNRIGAGLNGIVNSLYPPFTTVFAFAILGERLTAGDLVGLGLVVAVVNLPAGSEVIEVMVVDETTLGVLGHHGAELSDESSDRPARFQAPAEGVAVPERHPGRRDARCRDDGDAVVADVEAGEIVFRKQVEAEPVPA